MWWKPWTWYRLVGTTVVRESEFGVWDRALLEAHKSENIGPHGVPMDEAVDGANANDFIARSPETPLTDWAARALGNAQDRYYERYPKTARHGHIWRLKPRA